MVAPGSGRQVDTGRVRRFTVLTEPFSGSALERWFPLGLLAIGGAVGLISARPIGYDASRIALLAGLIALTAVWILVFGGRSRGRTVYLVGRAVLAAVLTVVNPFLSIFAFSGYVDCHDARVRRGWTIAIFIATAVTMAGAQSGGLPPEDGGGWILFTVMIAVNLVIATAVTLVAMRDDRISEERARTITALEAALAENAELHRELLDRARDAGVTQERQRLAREIHDTIAQGLAGIVTQLEAARETPDTRLARDHLDRATALARESLDEARRSVRDLTPRALVTQELPQALETLTTGWAADQGVPVSYAVTGTQVRLHPELEATLLRVAQESLTNVGKHADARRVGVTLSYMDDEVALDVRDDGIGFALGRSAGGFGLAGMKQRVARVAGLLEVETAPGQGVAVSVRLPSVPHA